MIQDEKFWAMVDRTHPSGCWLWLGKSRSKGYGLVRRDRKWWLVHRYAWFLEHGEAPRECALHRCDTPLCVRPSHLFEGTRADNNSDMTLKGRAKNFEPGHGRNVGERNPRAKLRLIDVERIREALLFGAPRRQLARLYGVSPGTVHAAITGWAA